MEEQAWADSQDETKAAFAARKLKELLRGTRKLNDVLRELREEQRAAA